MRWAGWLVLLSCAIATISANKDHFNERGKSKDEIKLEDLQGLEEILRSLTEGNEEEDKEAEALAWLTRLDPQLAKHYNLVSNANWNYATNITDFNAEMASNTSVMVDKWLQAQVEVAKGYRKYAASFHDQAFLVRLLNVIVTNRAVPLSSDPDVVRNLNVLTTQMEGLYSTATVPDPETGEQLALDPDLGHILASSGDVERMKWAWESWHDAAGKQVRGMFEQLVDNMNIAARENGFADVGAAWRYSDFEQDAQLLKACRLLWQQVKPLYQQLHAYVRSRLVEVYGEKEVGDDGYIPAHLLGNMWGQQWGRISELVSPYPDATSPKVDLKDKSTKEMFEIAENFFVSLGLEPMSSTFWAKSMIERPADREVVCHASADDFYKHTDFRIKMCTEHNFGDLKTIHHEMGHIEYFMQYRHQPVPFREGANAAFHEAVGDTIALSVSTPCHLKTVGLLSLGEEVNCGENEEVSESDINFLMEKALEKVAFLPFGLLVDLWRWGVFDGTTPPEKYNADWWKLKREFQGIKPPRERKDPDYFDPGAKYHISANVPYSRYFFAHIAQFQFHKAMCAAAGHTGPIFKCDIYNSTQAGDKLRTMLRAGSSQPWPETMKEMTGESNFSVKPMLEYFEPLYNWLKKKNKGPVGW